MLLPFVVEHGENIREHADIVGSGKERERTLQQVSDANVKGSLIADENGDDTKPILPSSPSTTMNNANNKTTDLVDSSLQTSSSISMTSMPSVRTRTLSIVDGSCLASHLMTFLTCLSVPQSRT
jgi:hypothetical protein